MFWTLCLGQLTDMKADVLMSPSLCFCLGTIKWGREYTAMTSK